MDTDSVPQNKAVFERAGQAGEVGMHKASGKQASVSSGGGVRICEQPSQQLQRLPWRLDLIQDIQIGFILVFEVRVVPFALFFVGPRALPVFFFSCFCCLAFSC